MSGRLMSSEVLGVVVAEDICNFHTFPVCVPGQAVAYCRLPHQGAQPGFAKKYPPAKKWRELHVSFIKSISRANERQRPPQCADQR